MRPSQASNLGCIHCTKRNTAETSAKPCHTHQLDPTRVPGVAALASYAYYCRCMASDEAGPSSAQGQGRAEHDRGARLFARLASPDGLNCAGSNGSSSASTSRQGSSSVSAPGAMPGPGPLPPGCPVQAPSQPTTSCSYAAAQQQQQQQQGQLPPGAQPQQQQVNPNNNMPVFSKASIPEEAAALSAARIRSSIPMAETSSVPHHQAAGQETWVYPSEQMFYAAMKRKGWQPNTGDMHTVVSIHNTVNERAWSEVMTWERMHECDCPAGPRLKKFQGRPNDLSPKARLLNMMGFAPPFDRHDWVVDRCGKDVRYIIDFYNGAPQPVPAASAGGGGGPAGPAPASFFLDVRPALDSVEAVWDRLRMQAGWVISGRWKEV